MLDPILKSAGFQQAVHDAVVDVLRPTEGQHLLAQAVARYLRNYTQQRADPHFLSSQSDLFSSLSVPHHC